MSYVHVGVVGILESEDFGRGFLIKAAIYLIVGKFANVSVLICDFDYDMGDMTLSVAFDSAVIQTRAELRRTAERAECVGRKDIPVLVAALRDERPGLIRDIP